MLTSWAELTKPPARRRVVSRNSRSYSPGNRRRPLSSGLLGTLPRVGLVDGLGTSGGMSAAQRLGMSGAWAWCCLLLLAVVAVAAVAVVAVVVCGAGGSGGIVSQPRAVLGSPLWDEA